MAPTLPDIADLYVLPPEIDMKLRHPLSVFPPGDPLRVVIFLEEPDGVLPHHPLKDSPHANLAAGWGSKG